MDQTKQQGAARVGESDRLERSLGEVLQGFRVVDLTLTLDESYPVNLPGLPPFRRVVWNWFEPVPDHPQPLLSRSYIQEQDDGTVSKGTYYSAWLTLFEHTGTHFDAPSHAIPPSNSQLEHASGFGDIYGDMVPLESLQGPAVVIDVRSLRDDGQPGRSPWVTKDFLASWEVGHGEVVAGDAVILRGGWDEFFVPNPEGERYLMPPGRDNTEVAWPAAHPELVIELADRGVRLLATDSPTLGANQDISSPHYAGLGRGMLFVEALCNLYELPVRGSYFVFAPLKVARSSGCSGRAFAYVPSG